MMGQLAANKLLNEARQRISRLEKENFAQSDLIQSLESQIKKYKNLVDSAISISFASPDILERNFESADGHWQYQREWMFEPKGDFENVLDAFEAMQKETLR